MIMMLAEIIGIFALSTLMGYFSFKTKKTTTAIGIGVSMNVFFMIGSRLVPSSASFMQYLLNAIPIASSYVLPSMNGFSFYFGIWGPYAVILEISAVSLVALGQLLGLLNSGTDT